MTSTGNWFCLRSRPKHEHIAAAHLRMMAGVEVFLPRVRFKRSTRQGLAWVTEALFPNYLFARFDWQQSLRQVQAARGVAGVVHFGDRWPVVETAVIVDLQSSVGADEPYLISAGLISGNFSMGTYSASSAGFAVSPVGFCAPSRGERCVASLDR